MNINSLSFFIPSFLSERKNEELLDLLTWIFFRISLLWDSAQREEYHLFYEVKRLSLVENSPEINMQIKNMLSVLCQNISDEQITQHLMRLNHGELGYQFYFHTDEEEKAWIKAHEVFEMLSIKWEGGVPFDRDRISLFPAHDQAIRIENIYKLALASENRMPLSTAALEYCRFYEDFHLTAPISYTSRFLDLANIEKNLTKNIDVMPNDPNEIEYFCDFNSRMSKVWSPECRTGLFKRYIFSQLSGNHPEKKLYLIALLRALEADDIYHQFGLETILGSLRNHLENFDLPDYWREESILQDDYFFLRDPKSIPYALQENYQHLINSFVRG